MERLGVERARLLSDNIELDRRAGELVEAILGAEEDRGRSWRHEKPRSARISSALDEALKQLRVNVQAAQERRSQIELELVRKQAELKYLG